MKLITSNSAFVQKKDLDFLINHNLALPESVILRIHSDTPINENNKYEFVNFSLRKEIKYFKNLDWIIDYNQIKNLTENELADLCQKTADEIDEVTEQYNLLSSQEKLANHDMITRCVLLDYKMHSIRDALWLKQGHINMEIPETKFNQLLKKLKKEKSLK